MSKKSFTHKDAERIANAMHFNQMKVARAARDLGVNRDTLYIYLRLFDAQLQQHYDKLKRCSVPELPRDAQTDFTTPLPAPTERNILRLTAADFTGARHDPAPPNALNPAYPAAVIWDSLMCRPWYPEPPQNERGRVDKHWSLQALVGRSRKGIPTLP